MTIAKIFDLKDVEETTQAVIVKTNEPSLQFSFELEDMIISVDFNYPDTDSGFETRDLIFEGFDLDLAHSTVATLLAQLNDAAGD